MKAELEADGLQFSAPPEVAFRSMIFLGF